jgi:tetratricopeptide (TPR) repeat protein
MTDREGAEVRMLLVDRLEQVATDIADVDQQEIAGEFDTESADRLRATYRGERARLEERIEELDDGDVPTPAGRSRRRVAVGVALLVLGFAAVTAVLLGTVRQREPGELATGGIASEVAGGNVDLSEVTNEEMEEVVAANPEVVGMRLALARRYFEDGEFDAALPHFMTILEEQDPDNAEALASVGWMTHLSSEPEVAERFVERAIEVAPDYPQALWFLANIRISGLDDPAGAVAPLEQLLSYDDIPADIRTDAEALLAEALSAADTTGDGS